MFSTLKVNFKENSFEEIKPTPNRLACSHCRFRKLKCTGQANGCDRCVSKQIQCVYVCGTGRSRTKSGKSSRFQTTPRRHKCPLDATEHGDDEDLAVTRLEPITSLTVDEYDITTEQYNRQDSSDTFLADDHQFATISKCSNRTFEVDGFFVDTGGCLEAERTWELSSDEANGQFDTESMTILSDEQPEGSDYFTTSSNTSCSAISGFDISPSVDQSSFSEKLTAPRTTSFVSENSQHSDASILLHEAVSLRTISFSQTSVASILHFNKQSLICYHSILQCNIQSFPNGHLMLLMLLFQNLVGAYEKVVRLLTEQYKQVTGSTGREPEQSSAAASPNKEDADMFDKSLFENRSSECSNLNIHDYGLDDEEEFVALKAITKTQLARLKDLARRLRGGLNGRSYDPHLNIAVDASEQIIGQLDKLNAWLGHMESS